MHIIASRLSSFKFHWRFHSNWKWICLPWDVCITALYYRLEQHTGLSKLISSRRAIDAATTCAAMQRYRWDFLYSSFLDTMKSDELDKAVSPVPYAEEICSPLVVKPVNSWQGGTHGRIWPLSFLPRLTTSLSELHLFSLERQLACPIR
jgi:hypothetical protein